MKTLAIGSMLTRMVSAVTSTWARIHPQVVFLINVAVMLLLPYIWASLTLTED